MNQQRESETEEKDQAWEERILCSDESCIGVVGPDGRCKECGRPYEGPLPLPSQPAPAAQPIDAADMPEETQAEEKPAEETEGSDAQIDDEAWQARKLCRDESCIGVIGPDGRCKECGRPYDE